MKRSLLLILLLSACQGAEPENDAPWALRQRYQDGVLALELRINKTRLELHERLRLRLDFALSDEAGLSREALSLPGWTVLEDRRGAPRRLADGRRALRRELLLEPFLPGDYAIPALSFRAVNAAGQEGRVLTELIKVPVTGALPKEEREQPGPLAPPPEPWPIKAEVAAGKPLWILAPGLGAAAAVIALILLRRRRPLALPRERAAALKAITIGADADARRAALDALEPALRQTLGAREGLEGAGALTVDELLARQGPNRERWGALLTAVAEARYRGATPEATELESWLAEGRRLAAGEGGAP